MAQNNAADLNNDDLDDSAAENPAVRMTDEKRMRASGAEESGYHAPTEQDIQDIRKDHHTSTAPHAVNADEFIRHGSSTDALEGDDMIANMHPHDGPSIAQSRSIGTVTDIVDGIVVDEVDSPADTTSESQISDDKHGYLGASRSAEGSGVDGDLDLEGPVDGIVAEETDREPGEDSMKRRSA